VHAFPANQKINIELEQLTELPKSPGRITGSGKAGWLLSHQFNDAFLAVNEILAKGGEVYWLKESIDNEYGHFAPGAIWISAGRTSGNQISAIAKKTGLVVHALTESMKGPAFKLQKLRLGMYRRYKGGNMDEGWTRCLFDKWNFPYQRIDVDAIKNGDLKKMDVFLIPQDSTTTLMGDKNEKKSEEAEEEEYPEVFLPPEYKKNLDDDSIKELKAFIRQGGTLVLMGNASLFAIDKLDIPITNVVQDLPSTEYFCPGSNLYAEMDITHPLAYGMPKKGLILNWGNPVFSINPSFLNEQIAAPVIYPKKNILKSGWLLGEKYLAGKAAALDIQYGKGRIIMLGFRSQHRTQTHGTFKILFNALYYGAAEKTVL
jgi:hypothetical protein